MSKKFYRVVIQLEEVVEDETGKPDKRSVQVKQRDILDAGDDPKPLLEYIHTVKFGEGSHSDG